MLRAAKMVCAATAFLGLLCAGAIPAQASLPPAGLVAPSFYDEELPDPPDDDFAGPSITIDTPPNKAVYSLGQTVPAAFSCEDYESGVDECIGSVDPGQPIDTTTTGSLEFEVNASDHAGNLSSTKHFYTVVDDVIDPTITVDTPEATAVYPQNSEVLADYTCEDNVAIDTCTGPVPDGRPIDTSTPGDHYFTVTATDASGNTATATVRYNVPDENDPTVELNTPVDEAVYGQHTKVFAEYTCDDDVEISECEGDVGDGDTIDTNTLGEHSFTVTATDASGNSATKRVKYWVEDQGLPTVTITSPGPAAVYTQGQHVVAAYACEDTNLATCEGAVPNGAPIDTSSVGTHSFKVTATDAAGNTAAETVTYTVTDAVDPTVAIVTPQNGAVYSHGQSVSADYSCADQLGSGIATCVGPVANGAAVDTATTGQHQFTVTATDKAGRTASKTVTYTVTAPPPPPAPPAPPSAPLAPAGQSNDAGVPPRLSISHRRVRLDADGKALISVRCAGAAGQVCDGSLALLPTAFASRLHAAGAGAIRVSVNVPAGESKLLRVAIPQASQDRLRRRGKAVAVVVIQLTNAGGEPVTTKKAITLIAR